MTFEELNISKPFLSAIAELGYTHPTTIQAKVFPVAMSGRDVCGIAQTGTGKTLAYLLPTLRQLSFSKDHPLQVLILVPTRELVEQVAERARKLTAHTSYLTVGIYGGGNIKGQLEELKNGADIVVATPGRLTEMMMSGALKTKSVKKLVIDEVDEMLSLGFRPQLVNILDLLPPKRQNLLFSATLTPEVETLMESFFDAPARVEAAPSGTPLESISQIAYEVPNFKTKVNLLELLLASDSEMSKVLVFTSSKAIADLLFSELEERLPDTAGVIHSNKDQNHRFESVRQFSSGNIRVLIATDLVSRGLDIAGVSHVINFDIPDTPENYLHRIGRTGRADARGSAVSFFTEKDTEAIARIGQLMQYDVPILPSPAGLVVSEVVMDFEQERIHMKNSPIKLPTREAAGPAFHEKLAKNKKVNVRRNHAEEKMRKYGRPIKRSGKK